jgi:hypothetical protein
MLLLAVTQDSKQEAVVFKHFQPMSNIRPPPPHTPVRPCQQTQIEVDPPRSDPDKTQNRCAQCKSVLPRIF